MTLLSLDQSSHVSGYAVFIDNELKTFGKFNFDDPAMGTRLMKIRFKIKELIEEYKPDTVVFEDIQLQNNIGNNVQTFKVLAEVYGIIEELLEERHIPYTIISASSWKLTLNIKGKTRPEQKRNAQIYIENKYNIKPTQDECDSICLGECYILTEKGAW